MAPFSCEIFHIIHDYIYARYREFISNWHTAPITMNFAAVFVVYYYFVHELHSVQSEHDRTVYTEAFRLLLQLIQTRLIFYMRVRI